MPTKPNLLLLIFDDLRGDALGAYNNPEVKTPIIDQIAAEALVFENAHTVCPLCNPSRAAMFSGMCPENLGVKTLKEKLKAKHENLMTWPHMLRRNGYKTMRAGKAFHKGVPDCLVGLGDGNDDADAWDNAINPGGYELHSNGVFKNLTPWETHMAGTGGMIAWLEAEKGDSKQHDYRVVDAVIEHVEQWQERPWMACAGFIRPHVPFVAPKEYFALYNRDEISLPDPSSANTQKPDFIREHFGGDFNLAPEDQRDAILAYYATISFVDAQIGRLVQWLKENGQYDNTHIILTADHGFHLGEHNLWFKNFPYRGSSHIPLIWRHPDYPDTHGQRTACLTDNLDIFPTILDAFKMEQPHKTDGRTLTPVFQDIKQEIHEHIHVECHNQRHAYAKRSHEALFIQWRDKDEQLITEEYYDLTTDPNECINQIDNPQFAEKIASMR